MLFDDFHVRKIPGRFHGQFDHDHSPQGKVRRNKGGRMVRVRQDLHFGEPFVRKPGRADHSADAFAQDDPQGIHDHGRSREIDDHVWLGLLQGLRQIRVQRPFRPVGEQELFAGPGGVHAPNEFHVFRVESRPDDFTAHTSQGSVYQYLDHLQSILSL